MIGVRNAKPEICSRLKNSVTRKFPYIAEATTSLLEGTVLDGELVALDAAGKPDFNLLQNFRSAESHILYSSSTSLRTKVDLYGSCRSENAARSSATFVLTNDRVQIVEVSQSSSDIMRFVREHHLEGVIAKRADSIYLPGKRTGLWVNDENQSDAGVCSRRLHPESPRTRCADRRLLSRQ